MKNCIEWICVSTLEDGTKAFHHTSQYTEMIKLMSSGCKVFYSQPEQAESEMSKMVANYMSARYDRDHAIERWNNILVEKTKLQDDLSKLLAMTESIIDPTNIAHSEIQFLISSIRNTTKS